MSWKAATLTADDSVLVAVSLQGQWLGGGEPFTHSVDSTVGFIVNGKLTKAP